MFFNFNFWSKQDFREPRLELPLILQFLPAMMSLIVDDQVPSYVPCTYSTTPLHRCGR